jgi:hypothetical protein
MEVKSVEQLTQILKDMIQTKEENPEMTVKAELDLNTKPAEAKE